MKTINNLRQYLPVLIFTTLFVTVTVEANAQRGEGWKKNEYKHERYEDRRGDDERHRDRPAPGRAPAERASLAGWSPDRLSASSLWRGSLTAY